jgi:hypothetical protein
VASSHWPCCCPCCYPCCRRHCRSCCRCHHPCRCRRRYHRRLRRRRHHHHRRRCPPRTSPRSPPRPRSTPTHPSPRAWSARRPGCRSRPPRQSPRSRLNHQTTLGERQESAHVCACHQSEAKNRYLSYSCPWWQCREEEESKQQQEMRKSRRSKGTIYRRRQPLTSYHGH